VYKSHTKSHTLEKSHPSFAGKIGVARADITPPDGIPARNWGAATHEVADSIHRPLYQDVVTFETGQGGQPLVLIEADLGFWRDRRIIQGLRDRILNEMRLESPRLIFGLTHTHAAASLKLPDAGTRGRALTESYLQAIEDATLKAVREALEGAQDATLEWNTGHCGLAASRDLVDPTSESDRFLCGYNPSVPADDTLLVGRITASSGEHLATLVNYACHPTTLAWENRAISPDFVGAMRETVETVVGGLTVFIQGNSGELAPRYQYVSDTRVADQHGRHLGFSVLATLEDMEPPGMRLVFDRVVESGAPLAVWRHERAVASSALAAVETSVELPIKDWPSTEELEKQRLSATNQWTRERLQRLHFTRLALGDADTFLLPIWVWRVGDAVFAGLASEAYSHLQQQLRSQFPRLAVVCMNLVNDTIGGYLPPAYLYDQDIYQVWRTPFDRGSLEMTTDSLLQAICQLTANQEATVLSDSASSNTR